VLKPEIPHPKLGAHAFRFAALFYVPLRMRGTIDFGVYKEFKLRPIENVELIQPESEYHPHYYHQAIVDDWRTREGGILFAIGGYGDFFDCMSHYHAQKHTGIKEWDTLFEKLVDLSYRKSIIPCMVNTLPISIISKVGIYTHSGIQFFGQKDGCLDRNCPFLHDREVVLADRAEIIKRRRETLSRYKRIPTVRQQMSRYVHVLHMMAGNDSVLRAEIRQSKQIDRAIANDRAYCGNPRCMRPWITDQKNPLKACTGCKYTMYCSVSV
jgi:hypothetical protein